MAFTYVRSLHSTGRHNSTLDSMNSKILLFFAVGDRLTVFRSGVSILCADVCHPDTCMYAYTILSKYYVSVLSARLEVRQRLKMT